MKRSMGLWQLFGFAVTSLGGTLLHFLYDWTGGSVFAAPFSGINESTWEHMKLLFWPMFLYAILQRFFFPAADDFWSVKLRGISLGLILIPVIFYTANGVFGKTPDWVNISIFFLAAAAAYLYETKLFTLGTLTSKKPAAALALLCGIGAAFVLFTFAPPDIGIFKEPNQAVQGSIYGIFGI